MKVLRSTFVAAVAIFAAACGDKVTVAGPTAVTLTSTTTTTTVPAVAGKVNSVSIAPATATLTIGQAITMIAAVNADAGVATTVTWTSSDPTKASVVAGLVTALAATPGVAICATSTANTGVKGCGSVVVTAASAVIPATATIAGVFGSTLTTPLDPTNVAGRVNVQVNINTGTEVVSKAYLLLGTTVVDSQNISTAQSAALRYAGENADAAKDVSQPTIILTANTAAYNATTGAVSFANATGQTLSVQLFVVGTTAARSTAKYSSTLTLNNTDAVYGSWTLPSTKVQAADAAGYQWTSLLGGTMTLDILPVIFSGKTVSSATVKYTNFNNTAKISCASRVTAGTTGSCYSTTAFGDTASVKTVTTLPGSASFVLYDRDMTRGTADANVITPPVPTISLIYSDGSTSSDANLTAKAGVSLALRVDNVAPANPTVSAPLRGALANLRSAATWTSRPATTLTDADSSALITAIGADGGVSNGATFLGDLRGINYKVYSSAGSTSSVDTASVNTTAITAASALTEGSYYCIRVAALDKLGNSSQYPDQTIKTAGTIISTTCPTTATGSGLQTRYTTLDNTAPVVVWTNNGLQFAMADTAVTAVAAGANYYYTVTEASLTPTVTANITKNAYSTGTKVVSCIAPSVITTAGTSCTAFTPVVTGTSYNLSTTTTTAALASGTKAFQYLIAVTATDLAGNAATPVTRVVVVNNTVPYTITTPPIVSTTVGADVTLASFASDSVAVSSFNAGFQYAGGKTVAASAFAAIFPADFSTSGMDSKTSSSAFTKFLNVSLSSTVTAAPAQVFGVTDINSAVSFTYLNSISPNYAMYAAGPTNLVNSSAAMAVSYVNNPTATGGTASFYAGQVSGLYDGSLSPAANALAVTPASGTTLGGTTTLGLAQAQSATFSMTTTRFALQTVNGYTITQPTATTLASKTFCTEQRSTTFVDGYSSAGAGPTAATIAAGTGTIGWAAAATPVSTASISVDVYTRVSTAASGGTASYLMKVGSATKTSSTTSATTCAGVITEVWSYSYTPGAQRTLLPIPTGSAAGALVFMVKAGSNQWIQSASATFTYVP